jgi:hypothetical protein
VLDEWDIIVLDELSLFPEAQWEYLEERLRFERAKRVGPKYPQTTTSVGTAENHNKLVGEGSRDGDDAD